MDGDVGCSRPNAEPAAALPGALVRELPARPLCRRGTRGFFGEQSRHTVHRGPQRLGIDGKAWRLPVDPRPYLEANRVGQRRRIFLDQSYWLNLIKRPGPVWREIEEALRVGVTQG